MATYWVPDLSHIKSFSVESTSYMHDPASIIINIEIKWVGTGKE